MNRILVVLFTVFVFCLPQYCYSTTFSWLPNKEKTLKGYKIHYGKESRSYDFTINVGKPPTDKDGRVYYDLDFSLPGKWYFAATAYDVNGAESDYSDEVELVWISPPMIKYLFKK